MCSITEQEVDRVHYSALLYSLEQNDHFLARYLKRDKVSHNVKLNVSKGHSVLGLLTKDRERSLKRT